MEQILSTGQVGRLLGVQPYRIAYAINTGQIDEASFRFLDKRCFTISDIDRIAQHFGIEDVLHFCGGEGGLWHASITTDQCTAELYRHGAHMTRWRPAGRISAPRPGWASWSAQSTRWAAGC